jgi:hypothetical protein
MYNGLKVRESSIPSDAENGIRKAWLDKASNKVSKRVSFMLD